MESTSECYVVHFISEVWALYHISETKVNTLSKSYRISSFPLPPTPFVAWVVVRRLECPDEFGI